MKATEQRAVSAATLADLERAEADFLEEMGELKARIERIQRDYAERLAALRIAQARITQNNSDWRNELRAQYTEAVSLRTLQLNEEFPVASR